jgi:type IV secretion system protein VirD4
MEGLAPIINCFWQQLISSMIQKVPDLNTEPHPLLCLIDEFVSLGRIEKLKRS